MNDFFEPGCAIYADEGGTEPHSDGIKIERAPLSDGSVSFNVLFDEGARKDRPGLSLRFACISEEAAWAFADELAHISWIEDRA